MTIKGNQPPFQFQTGAIRREYLADNSLQKRYLFQFQTGAIRRLAVYRLLSLLYTFQFQTGAIRRTPRQRQGVY